MWSMLLKHIGWKFAVIILEEVLELIKETNNDTREEESIIKEKIQEIKKG